MNHAGRNLEYPARETMETIRNAMSRQNMTVGEFADAMGVNRSTVAGWIGGTVLLARHHDMRLNAVCGNPPLPPIDEFSKEALRYVRMKYDITQRQLSEWLGVPLSSMKHWEMGKSRPRMHRVDGVVSKIKQLRNGDVQFATIKIEHHSKRKARDRSEHVRNMLAEINMTGSEIARRLGVSNGSVSFWKNGRWSPNSKAYERLKSLHAEIKGNRMEQEEDDTPKRRHFKVKESEKLIESTNSAEIIESLSDALSSIAKCISLLTGAAENGN